MAIEFDGINQYIEQGSLGISTTVPMTMFCWWYIDVTTGGDRCPMSVTDNTVNNKYQIFQFMGSASPKYIRAVIQNGTPFDESGAKEAVDNVGVWQAVCYVRSSATLRNNYVRDNSGNIFLGRVLDIVGGTKSMAGFNPNTLSIGRFAQLSHTNYLDGRVAYPAVWTAALSLWQVGDLFRGRLPETVQKADLWDAWRLKGTDGAVAGNQTGAVNSNVLVANNSPVYRPDPAICDVPATIGDTLSNLSDGTYRCRVFDSPDRALITRMTWNDNITITSGVVSTQVTSAVPHGNLAYCDITSQSATQADEGRNTFAGPLVLNHV